MEDRLKNIEVEMRDQGRKLDDIAKALNKIAIQQVEINENRKDINTLMNKWDQIFGPAGILARMQNFQASCPRASVKWVWMVLIPTALMQMAMAVGFLKIIFGG